MMYGIPIEIFIGLGAGLVSGGILYLVNPNWATKKMGAGIIGAGVGFLAAGIAWYFRHP